MNPSPLSPSSALPWLLAALLANLEPAFAASAAAPGELPQAQGAAQVAPITRVVLYPDSAVVERSVRVKAGDTRIEIPGLPANFSVQALQIDSDGSIRIGETTALDSSRHAPLTAEEARLDAEVKRLRSRIDGIEIDRKAAELELKYLDSLATPSESPRAGQPAATLQALRQGSIQAQRRILDAEAEKARLQPVLESLSQDLERIRPAVNEVRTLRIRVEAPRDGLLRLRYPLADAGWRPAYRASLNADGTGISLERTAQLAQRTGEDWSRVKLSLVTGRSRNAVTGPVPSPWNIQLRPEYRAEMARTAAYPAAAPAAAPTALRAKEPTPEPLFEVAASHGEYSTEYDLSEPLSLPADGRPMNVSLETLRIPVQLQVQVSPRQDKAAWLVATGTLPEGVWPAGEMQLYRNGNYVGSSSWDPAWATGLKLPFGQDEQIRVSVRPVTARNASSGLIGQSAERQIEDVFTVTSRHKAAVKLLVLEASPVGQDEKIELSSQFKPPVSHQDWDGRRGVVAWEQELKGGASQDFSVEYRIRWPKERQIIGLP
ncbi:DUF4139 domain-containing protein [Zoogloea sp.]|uniref:DUF4139 domain-containing protein n=1 Tax=Zoogloea sp. TaxID=49181 RepID=UPI0014163216|nr:MAG: DUF4139 domain-containing protein [Zoogloea sp.]